MQVSIKKTDQIGSLTLVQLETKNKTDLNVKPGGPAINSGGLVVTEIGESGVVGNLRVKNNTDDFLILTDADILSGAKQTRIVNKSVLLAPNTNTILNVSCVERSRWSKVSDTFRHSQHIADKDIRATKAAFFSRSGIAAADQGSLQQKVWGKVDFSMAKHAYRSATENYNELAEHLEKRKKYNEVVPEIAQGCNGLIIFQGGKLESLDVFGNELLYAYYFRGLINAAKRAEQSTEAAPEPDPHKYQELVTSLMETLSNKRERKADDSYNGAGQSLNIVGEELFGVELRYKEEVVHLSAFGK